MLPSKKFLDLVYLAHIFQTIKKLARTAQMTRKDVYIDASILSTINLLSRRPLKIKIVGQFILSLGTRAHSYENFEKRYT